MKKVLLFLLFSLFVLPNVYACNNSIKSSQKVLASNVNFNLDYKIIENDAKFYLTITGLNNDLYIVDDKGKTFTGNSEGIAVIDNLSSGQKYKYYIYSSAYSYCSFGTLLTRTISTPSYNPYYTDELCSDFKSSDLCSRWNNLSLTYDEFVKSIKRLENEQKTPQVDVVLDKKNIYDYAIWFVLGTVILSGTVMYIVKRKSIGF